VPQRLSAAQVITTDQKVGGSSPSGRAAEPLQHKTSRVHYAQSGCHVQWLASLSRSEHAGRAFADGREIWFGVEWGNVPAPAAALHHPSELEVCNASGGKVMSARGNGLRVTDKIELADAAGKPVLELREHPGKRPKVIVMSKGRKLLSVGERGSDSEASSASSSLSTSSPTREWDDNQLWRCIDGAVVLMRSPVGEILGQNRENALREFLTQEASDR
jgi:hypothetical protein